MRPSDLPPTTSASQLSAYARCPRQYYYRYVEHRKPEVRSPGLALGSAVHSALVRKQLQDGFALHDDPLPACTRKGGLRAAFHALPYPPGDSKKLYIPLE